MCRLCQAYCEDDNVSLSDVTDPLCERFTVTQDAGGSQGAGTDAGRRARQPRACAQVHI